MKTELEYSSVIIDYLNGCASAEQIMALRSWLGESVENKRIFDEMSDVWVATAVKNDNDFNVISGYQRIREQLMNKDEIKVKVKDADNIRQNKSIQFYRIAMRVAAIIIIALIMSVFFIYKSKNRPTGIHDNNFTEISAPMGSKTKVTLPDGTKVWLNAGSSLRYNSAFNLTNRKITLNGEAYFDVAKNKKVPFLVLTPEVTVKVLGTAFNVKAYPHEGSVETTLVRGALIVEQTAENGDKTQTILAPRQRATFVKQTGRMFLSDTETQVLKKEKVLAMETIKGKVLVAKEIDTEIFTAWKDNRLVFRNETFESLSVKLERWYGVKITLADVEIKNYHFNGTIENETINDVLDIVRSALPIDYSIQHNNITITKLNKSRT